MTTSSALLNEFLIALGSNRIAIDSKKRQLVDLPAYTSNAIIALFDTENKGHVTLADLYEFLKKKYIYPTEKELFTLFKEIDILKIGVIEPSQFAEFLISQTRLGFVSKPHFLDLESALVAVFQQHLDNSKTIQNLKGQLRSHSDRKALFKHLDTNRNGKVSTLEVRSFLLSHGCHEQDIISSTVMEIQNRLGCSFTEIDFNTFIGDNVVTLDSSSTHQSRTGLNFSIYNKSHKIVESTSTSGRKMTEFDQILEVRNHQNEERRHYLKEQERVRNKIMDDVLGRKRSYLNIRAKEEATGERIHRRWETEEDKWQHLEQKQNNIEPERTASALRLKQSDEKLGRTAVSPSLIDRRLFKPSQNKQEILKRAASDAQLKIQQIELNAKAKGQQRRRLETVNHEPSNSGYQQLLLKRNSELEIEKQKRQTLQKELSRSRDEIQTLKNYLQSIDKLNYHQSNFAQSNNSTIENHDRFSHAAELRRQKKNDILLEVNRQVGAIYESYKNNLIRGQPSVLSDDHGDNKYHLEQALRRSRVERQFAKFKLEKELARSRIPWR